MSGWKRLGAATAALALASTFVVVDGGASHAVDTSFGSAPPGTARVRTPVLLDPRALAVAADGGVVLASTQWDGSSLGNVPLVQRLTPSGAVDPTFGDPATPGQISLATQFNPEDVAFDAAGRIVVAAWNASTSIPPAIPPVIARLTSTGTRDTGFDGAVDTGNRRPGRLLQVTGGVVFTSWEPFANEACLHRLRDSDGIVDPTFGAGATPGRTCLTGLTDLYDAFGYPVAGGFVLVATTFRSMRVVRTDTSGAVVSDRSWAWSADTFVTDLRPVGDGFVVSAGDGVAQPFLARFDGDLQYDAAFNPSGAQPGRLGLGALSPESILVLPDERVLVVGSSDRLGRAQLFTSDGRADRALEPAGATPGVLVMPPDPQPPHGVTDQHFTAAAQSGDRVVLVGGEHDGGFGGIRNYADLVVVRTDPIGTPAPAAPGVLRPVTPARILDTRPGDGQVGHVGSKPRAGDTLAVAVAGRGGVPVTGAGAVVLNLTATEATAAGYVTVWPSGNERPTASNLNLERVGQTLPNLVVAPLGADGSISIYTQSGTHLLADVLGWFPSGGGLQTLVPTRILETRTDLGQVGYTGPTPAAGQTVALAVAGRAGVPASGVDAVVMNVTITGANAAGYVSVWPSGAPQPLLSNLNVERAGQTMQNLVIVPLGADGGVQLYTMSGGDLVADIVGWLPAGSGFVPVDPFRSRVLDTRGVTGTDPTVAAGAAVKVPSGLARRIVVANVTATQAAAPGYVTVWSGVGEPPLASNLNLAAAGQTIANLSVVATDDAGSFGVYTQSGTHVVVDVFGSFPLPAG